MGSAMEVTLAQASEARYRAMADPVRRRLLRVLEDSADRRDIEGLAGVVGLHPNTVRGHLEVLEKAGLVIRSLESRQTPGRPRLLYERTPDAGGAAPVGYRLLAEILTTTLRVAADDAAAAAHEAGRQWGRQLAEKSGRRDPRDPLAALIKILDDFGFGPSQASEENGRSVIELSDCPFRDQARRHGDIVCTLHLGMMRGATEALGDTHEVESLDAFVEPSLCRTVIRPR
jgi:predicted ArsR family transcriptional regulator